MVMKPLSISVRRAQALCSFARAISSRSHLPSFSPSSRLSDADEQDSYGRSSYGYRLSQSLPHNPSANALSYWPSPSSSSFRVSDEDENFTQNSVLRPIPATNTISVFWDLDNKPPHSVPPYEAAIRLREVACSFGRLIDMVAYANRHAFSYLPTWVKDERRNRKELDRLEVSGLVVPGEPYVCGYCGRRCKTNLALKKHFKQLHETERNKRLNRLNSLKGNKKIKYKQSILEKETKYREVSRGIVPPKVGYGLMQELKRAGVWVKMVSDRPQAADEALMRHISKSINTGIKCICLVSDDSDFLPVLHKAKAQRLHTVVVGDRPRLKMYADVQFSWSELANGSAFDRATELASMWYEKEGNCHYDLHMQSCVTEKESAVESKYFHVRAHDFQEWDVSEQSDTESAGGSDFDTELEESSDGWGDEG
ncbi:hypothetical protein L7F22_061439 [Adiantum nelumboides]|nr:hypothetical protein [Adiantum nelumboides]